MTIGVSGTSWLSMTPSGGDIFNRWAVTLDPAITESDIPLTAIVNITTAFDTSVTRYLNFFNAADYAIGSIEVAMNSVVYVAAGTAVTHNSYVGLLSRNVFTLSDPPTYATLTSEPASVNRICSIISDY
jgi:hypothetical protein